ncbi:MAG TPA: hypothetical protein VEC12_04705 [Bacteroidia bacterium]|nr:hypothetical protein [Bacteroidia bacterium]
MILIAKGQSNVLALTLTEKTTIPDPVYLFEFTGTQTRASKTFIAADASQFKERYNLFTVVEKTSPDALLGEVELAEQDFWQYRVFAQMSAANLDPEQANELVETGILYVTGETPNEYQYNGQPINAFVYNG